MSRRDQSNGEAGHMCMTVRIGEEISTVCVTQENCRHVYPELVLSHIIILL